MNYNYHSMQFFSRKLIKPENLNANDTLFGGDVLRWIDEESAVYAMSLLNSKHIVTKYLSDINFVSSARLGDIIEIGIGLVAVGTTSITLNCEVRNIWSKRTIISIEKIVLVHVDKSEKPTPHHFTYAGL